MSPASLRARITLVTVSVAVIAVLITAIFSLQFVRTSALSDAKAQLSAQLDIIVRRPALATLETLADGGHAVFGDTAPAFVSSAGIASGAGARYLTKSMVRRLADGASISTVVQHDGESVIVEGRPTAHGTAIVLARPQASVERSVEATAQRIIFALILGLIVALGGGAVLARWLTRPLIEAAETARRMAAGERKLTPPGRQPTEIAAITTALSTLDHALATSEGRQREFLLSISHDIRTPLTAVRGYAEALADGLIAADDIPRVGQTLVTETERLDRFVGDLLELARLEAEDFAIDLQDFDADDTLDEAVTAWQGRSAVRQLLVVRGKTVSEEEFGALPIRSDARRVRQLLDGLIENALRISPPGGTVTVVGRRVDPAFPVAPALSGNSDDAALGSRSVSRIPAGGYVELEVRDTGPGLSDADLAVVFDRGALHERYRNVRAVGTGLGLSIAARLVSRLGASIRAENADDGGARFIVRFDVD
ncbi:MAG: HAMP domain-containing histidine kinase [Microbacteriaceae bacterium]|nr:HAMP domain-containing histidine kinase [Microbacteriaceae bacterium]